MFCPHCGKEVAESQAFCQHCGASLAESVPALAPVAGGRTKTPWEDRENTGFFWGLFSTLKECLFKPSGSFRRMPVAGGLTDPLLYALIVGMVGMMFLYLWQILLKGTVQSYLPSGMATTPGSQVFQGIGTAFMAILAPFLIIIGLFITSGLLHLFLLLIKGARAGFEATFRVVSYSYSANIFFIAPICGSFIACIWALVITIIGLKEMHEISGGKAALAVFLPVFLCCGVIFLAASAVFMGVLAASLSTMMNMHK
jgi:hypothetical protein